ncbi:hypothetical protein [Herbiconiux liangxiaofengii]|uniref:hypothetical protein n=1 Tax=Herbiconiux liangxiaofengii TaxID=3342795 RepID=UPI0035BA20A1
MTHRVVAQRVVAHRVLLGLLIFGAVSAAGGCVLGVVFNGAGVPLAYLDGTPFPTFVLPGLILGIVIGGTQAAGAIAILRRHPRELAIAAAAGFGMIIWIFAELAIITEYSFLQTIYFALGIAELLLVLLITGVLTASRSHSHNQPGKGTP